MEKSVAATCCPVAGEVELLSGALDEQALTPVVAATANAAAAIKRNQDRVGVHSHAFGSLGEQRGISEVWVDGLEREPSAGEVARLDAFTEQYPGGEVGTDTAGAVDAHLAFAGQRGDLAQPLPQF